MAKLDQQGNLFKLFRAHLDLYGKYREGFIPCPVCKFAMHAGEPTKELRKLTVGHVFPKGLGYKLKVPECGPCNQTLGSDVDHAFATEERWNQFWRGERSEYAKGKGVSFELKVLEGGRKLDVQYVDNLTDPKMKEDLKGNPPKNPGPINLKMPSPPDMARTCLASLHSSLLLMFLRFGYQYANYVNTNVVQDVLTGKLPVASVLPTVRIAPRENMNTRDLFERIHIIEQPIDYCAFMVTLPVPGDETRVRLVVMPGIGEIGELGYQNHCKNPNGIGRFRARTVDTTHRNGPQLTCQKCVGHLHRQWWSIFPPLSKPALA